MTLLLRVLGFAIRLLKAGLSPFIRFFEARFLSGSDKDPYQPIFIIGAPRTGSTILYQAITNSYDVAYIDNIACGWHRNLRFGMWLSDRKYGSKPHHNFEADHGNTSRFGGHAPSECGGFWYRWLPKDRHFIDYSDITPVMIRELQSEIAGVSSCLKKPIIFKNLNAGQRLRLISQAFPGAKIIFVRRDPRFVIRSISRARQRVGVPESQWWSIMPRNVGALLSLPELEKCAAQVYYLEKQIEDDLELFPPENIKEVHYRDFDNALVHEIGEWIGVRTRLEYGLPDFQKDILAQLPSSEVLQLNALVETYPFSKELFV